MPKNRLRGGRLLMCCYLRGYENVAFGELTSPAVDILNGIWINFCKGLEILLLEPLIILTYCGNY